MITKIKSISNLGVFQNFNWDTTVRDKGNNIAKFKKFNILYGRNYSGKTLLSRIIQSLEKRRLSKKCIGAIFVINCDDEDITQNNLNEHSLNIRVYNEDFVDENLDFLKNEDGEIQPFAVLGEQNVEIENQIKEKEKTLGSEETKTGIVYDLSQKKSEYLRKKQEREDTQEELENKLTNKANRDIKTNRLYDDVLYNIRKINQDIKTLLNKPRDPLKDDEIDRKKKLLREEAKDDIEKIKPFSSSLNNIFNKTCEILRKEMKPTKSIQELINDSILQEWVREGIPHHKGKRDTCAFCGGKLPGDLWEKLEAHFNKESEELRDALKKHIQALEQEKRKLDEVLPISQDSFYSFYQDSFDSKKKDLEDEINKYNKTIDLLIKTLNEREKNIFTLQDCPTIDDNSQTIIAVLDNINLLIDENNQKTISLIDDQKKARSDLRLNEVLQFIRDIDYEKKIEKINELQHEESTFKSESESLEDKIRRIESEIEDLKIQLKDEKKGADKVNEYLNHFFGSTSIRFEAVEEEEQSGFKFQILRGNEIAYNLSEGERSLTAFCYFMAKLEEADTKGKELIIWIDDPVSSLDNNHIFFVFSLIETLIAKPNKNPDGSNAFRYKQLYISTHNLEFLKYLKRLSCPKNDSEYFLLERMVEHSRLTLMPDYLKKYVTEFNYLFHQIYKCSKIEDKHHDNEIFYNFGNNLRKFLEAYLFYKYPYHADDKLEKLRMFFKEDNESVALTNRISNELSHLEEIFDRSMKPVEIPEIPKLAKYVLDKIKENDSDQYCALLKSIGEAEA